VQGHWDPKQLFPGSEVVQLIKLHVAARVGVLEREHRGPQPVQVDVELHSIRRRPLTPEVCPDPAIDYREVRQLIVDDCTAEHTELLEALLARLCGRLMLLPGVVGVRLRLAKLAAFEDCEVAIRCEAGFW
jgi:dihydroneopterin aldolase